MTQEKLHIIRTEDTPEIMFDPMVGAFSIRGRSLPENAYNFYRPLIEFLESSVDQIKKAGNFEFHLDYFNSSSGRFIYEMLTIIEEKAKPSSFKVKWVVDKDDESMIEKGEELKSLVDVPFEIEKI